MKNKTIFLLITLMILVLGLASLTSAQSVPTVAYTVQPGDTLSKIARQYCTTWEEIYQYNQAIIGDDPSVLEPGTVIYIIPRCGASPVPPSGVYDRGPRLYANGTVQGNVYTAAKGDTLYSIGQRFGVPYQVIAEVNNITKLDAGDKIIIPGLQSTQTAPYVVITSPWSGATVSRSALPVYGVGGNLFEGNVVVRVTDSTGLVLGEQYTVLQGPNVGTGGSGSWSTQFYNLNVAPGTTGTILAFSPSAGPTASYSVPVIFQ
jgi:LysM repeat protein